MLYIFLCVLLFPLEAIDRTKLQEFSIKYSITRSGRSEIVFALENDDDEIALFYAKKGQNNLVYHQTKEIIVGGQRYNELASKNALFFLISKNKMDLCRQILDLFPELSNSHEVTNVSGKEQEKISAIYEIIKNYRSLEFVKILVEHGADINEVSYQVYWNWPKANPSAQNCRIGKTPLQLASDTEQFEILEYLVLNGANLYMAHSEFSQTIRKNQLFITQLFIDHGYKYLEHGFQSAIECNNIEATMLLINNGAKANAILISKALALEFFEIADLLTDEMLNSCN
jgi:ankyrin repeat protein